MPDWNYGTGAGNPRNSMGGGYTPPPKGTPGVNGPHVAPPRDPNAPVNYAPGAGKQGDDPNAPGYDPHYYDNVDNTTGAMHPMVGGLNGGANQLAGQYSGLAAAAQNRQGPTIDTALTNQDRAAGLNALDLTQQAAYGTGQSQAQQQLQQGAAMAARAQVAAANSARGGGGNIALAQRQAGAGNQSALVSANNQSQILRAQEMAAARAAYGQQATGLQSADQFAAGQQAQLTAGQRGLNDATSLGYEGLANGTQLAQLGADSGGYSAGVSNAQHNAQYQHDLQGRYISAFSGAGAGAGSAMNNAGGGGQ